MVPAVIIRKLYNKPLMFWVQDIWPDSVYAYGFKKTKTLSYFLNIFVKMMYGSVTAIAISSKGFKSKLEAYVRRDLRFNYLPNWADDLNMDLDAAELCKDTKIHFTFAGNIGKVQNLENIIDAFSSLPDRYQIRSQLNIIGDGSNLNNLKTQVAYRKSIIFFGKKPREEMAKYYKASDFLIVSLVDKPIFSITVPAKTQTYIAAKKPILAIINGDTADIIMDNNLGLCADPSDINSIAKAFMKCIDMSKSDRGIFVNNRDRLLLTTFNKEYIINHMTSILTS
jgi:glycosyltransferase involved in cell wall biosynthesis